MVRTGRQDKTGNSRKWQQIQVRIGNNRIGRVRKVQERSGKVRKGQDRSGQVRTGQ